MSFCGNYANAARPTVKQRPEVTGMEAKVEQAANEINRLRTCINNLVSVQGRDRLR
jgi:hypothetical protein